MTDEPKVLEIITKSKRRILLNKVNIILSSFICILTVVVVILASLRAGKISGKGIYENGSIDTTGWIIIALLMVLMLLVALLLFRDINKLTELTGVTKRPNLLMVASPPTPAERPMVSDFQKGLDGVSAAFGQTPPELLVSSVPGTAAFSYMLSRNRPAVAVTRHTLEASLSGPEAEALMAREVAHLSLGNISPGWRSKTDSLVIGIFTFAVVAFLCAFLFATISGLFGDVSSDDSVSILLYLAAVPAVAVAAYARMQLKAIQRHNDLLADSLACMATGNPAALKSALGTLRSLGLLGTWNPMSGRIKTNSKGIEAIPALSLFRTPRSTAKTDDMDERLKNIEAIELGYWPSFDDLMRSKPVSGKISTRVSEGLQLAFLSVCIIGLSVLVAFSGIWLSHAGPLEDNEIETGTAGNTETPEQNPGNPGTISVEEFDRLNEGMSYREVIAIIDGEGKPLISWNQDIRYWSSDGQMQGGARLDFKNDSLLEKTWLENEPVPMDFDQLYYLFECQGGRGMTYEQFCSIVPVPPVYETIEANRRVCYWPTNQYSCSAFAVFIENQWRYTGSGNYSYGNQL